MDVMALREDRPWAEYENGPRALKEAMTYVTSHMMQCHASCVTQHAHAPSASDRHHHSTPTT